MQVAVQILAIAIGAMLVVATLWSAMLTVVVPRAERPAISRFHFWIIGRAAGKAGQWLPSPEARDRLESRVAPFALVTLPGIWAGHIIVGFSFVYWGLGTNGFREALVLSGSALTTLGIRDADSLATLLAIIAEALIGLGLVALMISYLPTIYSAYTDREVAVARLEVRAGRPPHPVTFLERTHRIGWLDDMDSVWSEWENWFLEIEETHTTHASLPFFRSAYPGRSWLVTAATVLDSASLLMSTVDTEWSPRAALCVRSGFTTLRSLAEVYGLPIAETPGPETELAITREVFDQLCSELEGRGLQLKPDRDQAWHDFRGWRVNYEAAVLALVERLRIEQVGWFVDMNVVPNSAL